MSVDEDWGDLSGLRYDVGQNCSVDDATTVEDGIGADQSELEYESYADTSLSLVGTGASGPHCGNWGPMQFCDECAEVYFGQERCQRRTCPDCKHLWERERTVGGVQRLVKGRLVEKPGLGRRMIHAVASPDVGEITTLVDWYEGYRDAYQLAQEQGIRGGVVIGHGYRINDDIKARYRQNDIDEPAWEWIRNELPKDWREYCYWSPHYHIVGLCRDLAENKPSEQDKWNLVRLSTLDPLTGATDKPGIESTTRPFRYALDHATIESGTSKDCVRWFGSLATSTFQAEEHMSKGLEDVVDRTVEEVVGNPTWDEDDSDKPGGAGPLSADDCQCDKCGSTSLSSIFDAGAALMDKGWCEEIGREQERRLQTAFEWAIGEVVPPPGLRNPRTEEEANEAFEELL